MDGAALKIIRDDFTHSNGRWIKLNFLNHQAAQAMPDENDGLFGILFLRNCN